jgi:serine phosphatase RsbU (regulator of sigma subunit)
VEIAAEFESTLEDGSPLDLELLPGRLVSQGLEAEPLLVRSVDRRTGEERWRMLKATPVPAQPGEPRLAVNVIEDVTEVKRAELVSRFLAQASAVLASALDHEEALARVAELAVGRVADGCAITLLDDGGQPRTVATAGGPVDVPVEPVLHRGRSRMDGGRMAVALIASGRAIGAIAFARARAFIPADLELAEELGRRAGTAVEYARLYRERSHIAATLQRSLLPDALPTVPGMRLASLYRPAGQENLVGGDFYDAFPTPSGWMLLVGDVTGRGAEAAALTGQARHTLRTAGTLLGEPEAALEQLNQALAARAELTPCTVVIVHVAPDVRTATIHCAGHPPPLLVRAGDVRSVGHYGPMLGAWTESAWPCARIELRSGDVLVLYSDGVTDTVGEDERFGEARLLAALRDAADAGGAVRAIERALDTFQRGAQADDTAVLALDLPTA